MPDDAPAAPGPTRARHLALLFACGGALLLTGLDGAGLTDRDEGSNAEAAREMLASGDWISPTLNGEPRYAKPALTYWITAAAYAVFGVHDVTARLPSALFGLALLALQYGFLSRTLGPPAALCGSLALLLNAAFTGMHRMALTDPALVFFTTLAGYGFWLGMHGTGRARRLIWLLYAGMALAALAKGPVGILIPLLGIVPYLTLTRQWPAYLARGRPLAGWALCLLIAAPWYLAMFAIHGADYAAAAAANTAGRFAAPMEGHGGTVLLYVPVLLLGFFPWSGLLAPAVVHALRERRTWAAEEARGERGPAMFCAVWTAGIFVFFTLSATRLPHYLLPLFPPAAALAAVFWSTCLSQAAPRGLTAAVRTVFVTGCLLSGLLVSLPLVYAQWRPVIAAQFPAAAQEGLGAAPAAMGAAALLGVTVFRRLAGREARRPQAFQALAVMMGAFLLTAILAAWPRVGRYAVNPPQALAAAAGAHLAPGDRLVHMGRKLPSLSFYAKRRVYHINPGEEALFAAHVEHPGRLMVILPVTLRDRLPAPVSSFATALSRHGFLLLSSDPAGLPHSGV